MLNLIELLKDDFRLTNKGDLDSFFRTQFKKTRYNVLELSKLHSFDRIIDTLGLKEESEKHSIPSSTMLSKDIDRKL